MCLNFWTLKNINFPSGTDVKFILGVPVLKHIRLLLFLYDGIDLIWCFWIFNKNSQTTVKILKFGTPQTIAIIVLKIEKFDVTLH